MKKLIMNLVLVTTIGLVGCSTNSQKENTGIGALSGAAIGGVGAGLLGGNSVAIGASIVGGALIGGLIGHNMDSSDTAAGNSAIKQNQTNQTTRWVNPKTGVAYTMTPTSDLYSHRGNPNCRDFHFTSTKNGKMQESNGTACLMKDGYWHKV